MREAPDTVGGPTRVGGPRAARAKSDSPAPGSPMESPPGNDAGPGARQPVSQIEAAPITIAKPNHAPILVEVSWETCNQVGGIYQVIRSKVPHMIARWGDRYLLIGPYDHAKAAVEFEASKAGGWLAQALQSLESRGLRVHYGRWLVPGRPRVMLIEHGMPPDQLGRLKYQLWSDHGIETPANDWLVDQVCSFAHGVYRLLEAMEEHRPSPTGDAGMVAHFHEWMAGLAIPMIRRRGLGVATVFTTHATILGRYLASSREDFYDHLRRFDHDAEARNFNIAAQHKIERACAHGSHVFTTVSTITAEECDALLGRPVDVVLPNGLTVGMYNAGHEQQRLHGEYKEVIHKFTMGHFFPSYSFDLDRTLYFFTSGRFEPRNKGFDVCLEAMARLNARLKAANLGKTAVFFIVTRRPTRSINPLAMEKRGVLNELNEICNKIAQGVQQRLFYRAAARGKLHLDDLVDEYWMLRYRRSQHALKQNCLPMVVTHILEDDANDPVLAHIRYLDLINREEDPVKVVYHPEFINPHNRLWGIEYDQFVRGCHFGLFPSSYEPWGYTPLESAAMGVPSVTSDLAGFGRYLMESYPDHDRWGMKVIKRRGRGFHEAAEDLAAYLFEFCALERRDRIAMRNEVDRHSWDFDWSKLGRAYHAAHDLALARFGGVRSGGIPMVPASSLVQRAPAEIEGE